MSNGKFNTLSDRSIFWFNLEKIRDGLIYTDIEFSQFLGIGIAEYYKCKDKFEFLPVDCVFELAEKLNFHFTDLLNSDFKLVINDPSLQLPEKYSFAKHSKLTPVLNIISYIEKTRGVRAKTNLLRKFQLNESFLNDENSRTNIHLISDVVSYLHSTYHLTENEFLSMGKQTIFSKAAPLIKEKMKDSKDIVEQLDIFVTDCGQLFDKNCHYRIVNVSNDFAIMEGNPIKDVIDELKINAAQFGNEVVCMTKMGCISSFSWFAFNRYAPIQKFSSVYEGGISNRYIIDLSPFKNVSSSSFADILPFNPIYQ